MAYFLFFRLHYKEHLVKIINQNRLDPVDMYDLAEIKIVLNREKIQYQDNPGMKNQEYLNALKAKLKQESPLPDEAY